GHEAPVGQVAQEAAHVILIVGADQGESYWQIAQRIGGQQQGAVAQVDFVDTQRAREALQGPLPIPGQIDLADLPVEAVVQETIGQFEVESPLQRPAQRFHAHAVVEQAVDNGLAHPVAVFGPRLDTLDLRPESLATIAAGAVLSHLDFEDDDLAIGDVADTTGMHILAPSTFATLRAGEGPGSTLTVNHACAWLNSIHACVPPWVWSYPNGRHRLVF